ncbi:hypothetical protein YB2330_006264 [Saitoella coloradoensis]
MADYDDEDLFKDLYGDEEPSKPVASTPVKPPAAVPSTTSAPQAAAEQELTSTESAEPAAEKATDPRIAAGAAPAYDQYAWNQQQEQQTQQQQEMPQDGQVQGYNPYAGASGYDQKDQDMGNTNGGSNQGSGSNKDDGKMFIGGLNWETTEASMREYFEQFGPVTDCSVMRDGVSGRSRGFGFLTFENPESVDKVVAQEHYLDGKRVDPKRAIPREEQSQTSKIFVGGVSPETSEQQFRTFFSQFGKVVDATLMIDKETGRARGFGFVTFETDAAVEQCVSQGGGFLNLNGKQVEVKRAQPKGTVEKTPKQGAGGFGAGVGGAGAYNNPYAAYGGANPTMMAQYFQRMQAYMLAMQQMQQGGGMNPMMQQGMMNPMMGGMNPMMQQQMMGGQMGGGQMGGAGAGGAMAGRPQNQGVPGAPTGPSGGAGAGYTPTGPGGKSTPMPTTDAQAQAAVSNSAPLPYDGVPTGPAGGGVAGNDIPINAPTGPANAPSGPAMGMGGMGMGGGFRGGFRGGRGMGYQRGGRGAMYGGGRGRGGFHPYAR